MRWGNSNISFIRPIRWLLIILNDKHLSEKILGVISSSYTFGNKINTNKKINISNFDDYFSTLKRENIETIKGIGKI